MPIVDEETYKNTEKLVKEFCEPGGLGEKLQKILLDIAQEKDNWVSYQFFNRI